MKSARILVIGLLVVLSYWIISPSSAHAQTTNPYLAPNANPDVSPNLHNWTQSVMIDVMASLMCQLTGIDPTGGIDRETGKPIKKCLGYDPANGKLGFYEGGNGAVGAFGNLIAMTFNYPPASTAEYLSYMGDKFGIVEPAYAQGTGFNGIRSITKIWEVFRNITYLAFIIVFVAIGLAIMFRVKIDPRTVMTIQNSIPRIIIGLVLATFSFAIAGLLIDVMYIVIYLFINIGSGIDPKLANVGSQIAQSTNTLEAGNTLGGTGGQSQLCLGPLCGPSTSEGPTGGFLGIVGPPANAIGGIATQMSDNLIVRVITAAGLGLLGALIGPQIGKGVLSHIPLISVAKDAPLVGGLFEESISKIFNVVFGLAAAGAGFGFGPQIIGGIAFLIAGIIIAIALLWALFRLWIQLLSAYIGILLAIVFAPFWILVGVVPGAGLSFGLWLRDILGNLAAFPVTIGMFLLGRAFIDAFAQAGSTVFVPPMVGPADPSAIGGFIGLGIILLTPQVVTMTRDFFKAPKFPYGAAIGQAIAVGPGVAGSVAYTVGSPYGMLGQIKQSPLGAFFGKGTFSERVGNVLGRPQVPPVERKP